MFIKKLLFTRQFLYQEGRFEILGEHSMLLPIKSIVRMQYDNPDQTFFAIRDSTQEQFKAYLKKLQVHDDKIIDPLLHLFELYGIGKLSILDLNIETRHALVQVHDTPLVSEYEHGREPVCSVVCGFLSGMFSALFDAEVHATINKCKAKGQNYCEFIIK
jgi:hypothetical protein